MNSWHMKNEIGMFGTRDDGDDAIAAFKTLTFDKIYNHDTLNE
jgi:hypothetical protein